MGHVSLNGQPQFGARMAQFADPANLGEGNCNRLPTGDLDGDGMANYTEWLAGTSAANSSEVLRVRTQQGRPQGTDMVLKWDSVAGRTYSVWCTTDLKGTFERVTSELQPTPPENTYTGAAPSSGGACFYRIQVADPAMSGQ